MHRVAAFQVLFKPVRLILQQQFSLASVSKVKLTIATNITGCSWYLAVAYICVESTNVQHMPQFCKNSNVSNVYGKVVHVDQFWGNTKE